MPIVFVFDSAVIGAAEYGLASDNTVIVDQADDCILQAWIDFAAMTAPDRYQVRITEKINGGAIRDVFPPVVLDGVQPGPYVSPSLIVGEGWEVRVKKLAGTDRTIHWSLRKIT